MQINKIMSNEVVTISADADLLEASTLMKEFDIRHLPVVEKGKLIGLVTESDVRGATVPAMIEDLKVRDIMVSSPYTVTPETMLEDAARLVYRHKIGCLPVVDKSGRLKGIITVADMLAALIELTGFLFASSRLDVVLPDYPEALEEACRIIQQNQGRIIGVSLTHLRDDRPVHLFRLHKTDLDPIVKDMAAAGYMVISTL